MKKFFYLLALSCLLLNFLFISPVMASGHGNKGGNTPSPVALPINTFIILLAISGVLIGALAIRKYKTVTAQE